MVLFIQRKEIIKIPHEVIACNLGGIIMVTYKSSLAAINDVKDFVNMVMRYDFDVDLISGRYAVDAKSIMGIFSLDLSKPIELKAHTDEPGDFAKDIEKYIVK